MAEKHGPGCLKPLLILLLVVLILAIGVPFLLAFLAIGAPVSYPAPKFDARDKNTMANVITRLARSLVDKEGRVVETAVLKLSPDEVQTLVNAAIRSSNHNDFDTLPYAAQWDNGLIRAYCSMPLSSDKAANLYIEVTPIVDKGHLTLIPGRGKVGRLSLPRAGLNAAADNIAKAAMEKDSVRTSLSAFTRIEPGEDGTLLLMFDPRDVNTVVRILRSAGEEDPSAAREEKDDEDEDEEEWEETEEDEEEWEEMEELEEEEENEDDPAEGTDGAETVESDGGGKADAAEIQPVL